ncbi:hypothetical protein UPYG_G00263640 [Umbra pygmaea]|uniref:Cadherin domain-containing protein n=1 Tax=Umbra pygmaea TaxID=75934 RepID=A0ABD0WEJ0_UMBPY
MPSDSENKHVFHMTGAGVDMDPKGVFTIDRMTGEVFVSQELDREAISSYTLEVSVTDINGRLMEGPVALQVDVNDQNDNRPIFTETRYAGEVLEGSPTGTGRCSHRSPSTSVVFNFNHCGET